jgi:hypothetical protein
MYKYILSVRPLVLERIMLEVVNYSDNTYAIFFPGYIKGVVQYVFKNLRNWMKLDFLLFMCIAESFY